jgi:hypothetical protein
MYGDKFRLRSVRRERNSKRDVIHRQLQPVEKEKGTLSDAKAKALLQSRLMEEISQKEQARKEQAKVVLKESTPEPVAPVQKPVEQKKSEPEKKEEAYAMPEVQEESISGEEVRAIYHRVRHVTMTQLLYQARQTAKAYDASYLALQDANEKLAAKLDEIKQAKTPSNATDAVRAEYTEKRKAMRKERDALQKKVTVSSNKAVPLERVCDEYEAVASWKLEKEVAFRKQKRINPVDGELDENIKQLKNLVNTSAGTRTTMQAILPGSEKPSVVAEPQKKPEPPKAKDPIREPEPQKVSEPVKEAVGLASSTKKECKMKKNKKKLVLGVILVAVVVVLVVCLSSCSGKKTKQAETTATTAPSKPAETKTSTPVATAPAAAPKTVAPQPVEAPKSEEKAPETPAAPETEMATAAPAPAPAPAVQEKTTVIHPFQDDVTMETLSDGTTVYTFRALEVRIASNGDSQTLYGGSLISSWKVTGYADKDGKKVLSYANGTKLQVASDGTMEVVLPVGVSVAFSTDGGMRTSYSGLTVTDEAIVSYALSDDGSVSLTYADGMKASIRNSGAEVSLPLGVMVSITSDGMVTSFQGMPITYASITGYEKKDGSYHFVFSDGMDAHIAKDGKVDLSFGQGLTVAIASLDSVMTRIGAATLNETPIDDYMATPDGAKLFHFTDGMVGLILADGSMAVSLSNGLMFAVQGDLTATFLGQLPLSISRFAGYSYEDGQRTVSYEDGTKLVISKEGWTTASLSDGVTIAVTPEGYKTTYQGIVVTNSPLSGYLLGMQDRTLAFADGMQAKLGDDGSADIAFPCGAEIVADKNGIQSMYMGIPVSNAAITSYALADNGTKTIGYADGMKVVIDQDGMLSATLANGLGFAADGSTTYKGTTLTTAAATNFQTLEDGAFQIDYADGISIISNKNGIMMPRKEVQPAPAAEKPVVVAVADTKAAPATEQKAVVEAAPAKTTEKPAETVAAVPVKSEPVATPKAPTIVSPVKPVNAMAGKLGLFAALDARMDGASDKMVYRFGLDAGIANMLRFGKASGVGLDLLASYQGFADNTIDGTLLLSYQYNWSKVMLSLGFGGFYGYDLTQKASQYGIAVRAGVDYRLTDKVSIGLGASMRKHFDTSMSSAMTLGGDITCGIRF